MSTRPSARADLRVRFVAATAAAAAVALAAAACGGVDRPAPGAEVEPPPTSPETGGTETGGETGTGGPDGPADPRLRALEAARERWARSGPESYRLAVSVGCAAPCPSGPFLVTVERGEVVDVAYSVVGPEGEPPALARELSVEGLFALVEDALSSSLRPVEVEYDEATGMPLRAFLEGVPEDAVSFFEARLLVDVDDPELAAARERWRALGLERYVLELHRGCFCPPEYVGPFRITVAAGEATTLEFAPGGPAGEPPADALEVLTVEDLFAAIEEAKARGAAAVRASYDPQTGIPTEVYIDEIAEAVDEEVSYTARLVRPRS